ncbi:hypothetical protein DYU05_08355 [Mucilaginibacter terrenus]|uniref:Outer membrane protein beta-barrel domain-containing protein n=1 Tax=Mucilaginibacter terrenus TaxID=2482727 RepID=A0A3E2NX47_9SPHI|nr:outer membrane beta-barrel protein [Mucilaginibacter terrenus]RFZ85594.1 hypothetical protein DYU05_08355 [Mucilaginibacter terrenus]
MDDQFDKKLASRIREVFDNYEHPEADMAWAELRKKFPAKQEERKVAWLWWSSAAAILLIMLGIGIWAINKPHKEDTIAIKPAKQVPVQLPVDSATTIIKKPSSSLDIKGDADIASVTKTGKNHTNIDPFGTVKTSRLSSPQKATNFYPVAPAKDGTINSAAKSNEVVASTIPLANNQDAVAKSNDITSATTPARTDEQQPNTAVANPSASVIAQQPAAAKTINDLFKEDVNLKKQATEKKEAKRVNFSVYAATYFNYADGSANQVNAGAGVTSDIRLSRNFKLSTGVMLAQNSLQYDNAPPPAPTNRAASFAAAVDANVKKESLFAASSTSPEFDRFNATLVGLDIPLNIKFEFNPAKSNAYVSAGLSSGTFIDERYTARYTYRTNGIAGAGITSQDQTSTQSFGSFYFAKTVNFALGFGTPVGKNRLVIEPFLKYPIGGMGSQDIRFGSGGVNLKFNFKSSKK